jgi:tetratricopeptide (TPR) repeat protein
VATLEATLGQFDEARSLLAEAKQVARSLSATWYTALVALFSGRVERLAGDPGLAATDFRHALAVFSGMGERWFQGIAAIDLARLFLSEGRRAELGELRESIRDVEELFDPEFQMKLCAFRAREVALDGGIGEALALADRAVAIAQTTDQLNFHAEVLRDRADVFALAGRHDPDAARDLEQALELYAQKGNLVMAERTRSRLAELTAPR